jgi:hypothetical protein
MAAAGFSGRAARVWPGAVSAVCWLIALSLSAAAVLSAAFRGGCLR